MDDYMFEATVDRCRAVNETTSYLEIFTYSVSLPLSCLSEIGREGKANLRGRILSSIVVRNIR